MTNQESIELVEFTKDLLKSKPLLNRMVSNVSIIERSDPHLKLDTKDGYHSYLCLNEYAFSKFAQYIPIHIDMFEEAYAAHLDQKA